MRRPTNRCTPATVSIQHWTGWTKDAAGGRAGAYGSPITPVYCAIDETEAEETDDHQRDTHLIRHSLIFHDDWAIQIRDLITWGTRVLNVVGVQGPRAGKNRSWVVSCEERK